MENDDYVSLTCAGVAGGGVAPTSVELGALVNDGNAGDTLLAGPSGGENTWKLEEEKLEEKNWRRKIGGGKIGGEAQRWSTW